MTYGNINNETKLMLIKAKRIKYYFLRYSRQVSNNVGRAIDVVDNIIELKRIRGSNDLEFWLDLKTDLEIILARYQHEIDKHV